MDLRFCFCFHRFQRTYLRLDTSRTLAVRAKQEPYIATVAQPQRQHNASQMTVPVWIVTWILHLAIKSPAPGWVMTATVSLPLSLCRLPSGFSAHRSLNPGLSDDDQSGTWRRWLKNTVPIFVLQKQTGKKTAKKNLSFFFLYLFNVFIGLCNLSVAIRKRSVLQESVFARRQYLRNYIFTTLFQKCLHLVWWPASLWMHDQEYTRDIIYSVLLLQLNGFYWGDTV